MLPGAGDRCGRAAAAVLGAAAAALMLAARPLAARDLPGTEIRDLHYGEVLFHFYQQDDFTALTHLLAARHAGRLSHHDHESELLLGGLYLAYGQHRQAGEIFSRLLDESADPAVRDRAWFYLGKVRYQRGRYASAEAALRRVGGALPERLAAEHRLLLAQCLMQQMRYAEAAALLGDWHGPADWTAYARLNLGVAFVRDGDLAAGAEQLERVGQLQSRNAELRDLRDKANLALGYAYLQAQQPAAARAALSRVRVNGPFSNKALLGAGWADALNADYRQALVPWLALRDRDLLDSAVQESLLAIPYAFGRLEAHGSAADHYLSAIAAFDAEIARLDAAVERARQGALVPALLRQDDPEIGRWYWQLAELPSSEDSRYLYHLIANHEFQDGLRNVRDLLALGGYLRDWAQRLDAFADILDTREQAYRERLPRVAGELGSVDLGALRARRDALAARLAGIATGQDPAALATAEELDQWQRLEAVAQSPAWSTPAAATARDRQRLLKGLLQWRLEREFRYRLYRERRALAGLDEVLAAAERSTAALNTARQSVPQEIAAYRERLLRLAPRLERLQGRVLAALDGEQQSLQRLAIAELDAQRSRLATYRVQARFALATIYDRANAAAANREPLP